jgi:hypothetical protein
MGVGAKMKNTPIRSDRLSKLDRQLWAGFKIGLPVGIVLLIIGSNLYPQLVPLGELVMALACVSCAIAATLELCEAIRQPQRCRSIIGTISFDLIFLSILLAGAVTLIVFAFRGWPSGS